MIVGFAFMVAGALWRGLGNLPVLYGVALVITAGFAVIGLRLVDKR